MNRLSFIFAVLAISVTAIAGPSIPGARFTDTLEMQTNAVAEASSLSMVDTNSSSTITWNGEDNVQSFEYTHPDGGSVTVNQELYQMLKNKYGGTVTNGQPVSFSAFGTGGRDTAFTLSQAGDLSKWFVLGVYTGEDPLNDESFGRITWKGIVQGVELDPLMVDGIEPQEGSILYLATDEGMYTTNRPAAPVDAVVIGAVNYRSPSGFCDINVTISYHKRWDELDGRYVQPHTDGELYISSTGDMILLGQDDIFIVPARVLNIYAGAGDDPTMSITPDEVVIGPALISDQIESPTTMSLSAEDTISINSEGLNASIWGDIFIESSDLSGSGSRLKVEPNNVMLESLNSYRTARVVAMNGSVAVEWKGGVGDSLHRHQFGALTNYFSTPVTVGNAVNEVQALNRSVADTLYADIAIEDLAATEAELIATRNTLAAAISLKQDAATAVKLGDTFSVLSTAGAAAGDVFYANGSGGGSWAAAGSPTGGITRAVADILYGTSLWGISVNGDLEPIGVSAGPINDGLFEIDLTTGDIVLTGTQSTRFWQVSKNDIYPEVN